jgi:hypothetical protein
MQDGTWKQAGTATGHKECLWQEHAGEEDVMTRRSGAHLEDPLGKGHGEGERMSQDDVRATRVIGVSAMRGCSMSR